MWGFTVRGSWRSNITAIFWPQSYGHQRCVFLVLQGCSTGGPGPTLLADGFLYCILSASSLDPNSSGPKWPLRPDVAFLTTSHLQMSRTQLSYIIVRRPLDLCNRMFNRHQAEITVMQFRGHSLPVHQFMSVPWEFFSLSHFISQFPPTRFPLITAITMCQGLQVNHLGMEFLAGSKGQNITGWRYLSSISITSGSIYTSFFRSINSFFFSLYALYYYYLASYQKRRWASFLLIYVLLCLTS